MPKLHTVKTGGQINYLYRYRDLFHIYPITRSDNHLIIPIDVQEWRLKNRYSLPKVPGHKSDVIASNITPNQALLDKAAEILNTGNKDVVFVGHGALGASDQVTSVCERLVTLMLRHY
jgi:thiamine pyrophosphate-dependent acetolactate synthase large subunit-like protein